PGIAPPDRKDPETVGPYRTIGRVSRDAAGTALLGVDPHGAPAVIRVVPTEVADAGDVRARLATEVDRIARCRAVCAARHRDADVRDARPWSATEYVPGRTLAAHVTEFGPLRGSVLTALATGLAEALTAWHVQGGAHLGLDPTRVVLSPRGPKVVDLGVSSAVGASIGDPRWVAPEQRAEDTEAGGPADVFTWGHLVRFAATGWEPSGDTVADPDLGDVPESLASLVREALAEAPEERPTALHLLRALTGRTDGDLGAAVSDLLARTWVGVNVPAPRRVRRARTSVLMGATAIVLVGALVGGWLVWDPGEGTEETASADDAESTEGAAGEEPAVPTVAEEPEAVDAAMAEAIALALEASTFTTFEHRYSNDVGDTTPVHYLQTDAPVPAISHTSYLGPIGSGVMALGSDFGEIVYLRDRQEESYGRVYYRDPDGNAAPEGHPREKWEDLVEEVGRVLEVADPGYEGTGTAPTEYMPPEILGDGDLSERTGHRYTATYVQEGFLDHGPLEATLDFWVDEAGYPLRFERRMVSEVIVPEFEEVLVLTHLVEFARFDLPVDAQVPTDDEILPEPPDQ
ncbi:kinase, partial [Nocardiopsis sp. MG754419]|uniref:serine/threonine protein kinase n=1 Tax=Nocardiopsis sp. MG754419 TaxID=2259865 RepID=UPI001BABCDF0